jgi:large repetitive protein
LLHLVATTHTNADDYPVDAWTFDGNGNYKADAGTVHDVIAKAAATVHVTWSDWTFDDTAHLPIGSVTGVGSPAADLGMPSFTYYSGSSVATGTLLPDAPKAAGTYTVRASFAGNTNYNADHADATVMVSQRATATAVTSSANPSKFGQQVTFTAAVTSVISLVPAGSVQWKIDGANVGSPVALDSSGKATLVRSDLSAATHTVTAVYGGSTNFLGSTGYLTGGHVVDKANTTTTVVSSKAPTVFGESVTFTATVAVVAPGAGTPGGTVQWKIDGTNVGSPGALDSNGKAILTKSDLSVGNHPVTAVYSGSVSFVETTGSLSGGQDVNKASTTTAVTSFNASPNFGDSVTFTATVAAVLPGAGIPDGSVQWKIDGTNFGSPVALDTTGKATLTKSDLTAGSHTVSAYYSGSSSFLTSNGALAGGESVGKKATSTSVTATLNPQQYSDKVTLTARIAPDVVAGLAPATGVTFKIGSLTVGTASFAAGTGSDAGKLVATLANVPLLDPSLTPNAGPMAPGSKTVTATITGKDPNFTVNDPTTLLTITQEDARATYTGDMLAFTSGTGGFAKVTLRTTVQDITAVDPALDPNAGDIQNAKVTFTATNNGTPVPLTGCSDLSVALLVAGDTKTGSASCVVSDKFNAGSNSSGVEYQITTTVSGYYTNASDTTTGPTVIEVADPTGQFITGGGYLVESKSAGSNAAANPSKMNFGFNVHYNNKGTNTQGHVNIIYRNGGRVYQIKTTAVDTFGTAYRTSTGTSCTGPATATCWGIASWSSKANLTDVTNPNAPVSIGGGLSLQMSMTDKGEPGKDDTIAVTLWNGSTLVFSSNWDGAKTPEQLLGGGNLVVH